MTPLAAYVLAFLTHYAPVESHDFTRVPREVTRKRYEAIASDIAETATEAPLFAGPDGVVKTALLEASVAVFESGGLRKDVDECAASGDSGAAWSLFQLQTPWTPRAVSCASRASAARAALDVMRRSMAACRALPQAEHLTLYAVGACKVHDKLSPEQLERGKAASRNRYNRAVDWLRHHPLSN